MSIGLLLDANNVGLLLVQHAIFTSSKQRVAIPIGVSTVSKSDLLNKLRKMHALQSEYMAEEAAIVEAYHDVPPADPPFFAKMQQLVDKYAGLVQVELAKQGEEGTF